MDVEQKLACSLDDLIKQDHQKHGGGGGGFRRGAKPQINNFDRRRPRRHPGGSAAGGPGGGGRAVSRPALPPKALSSHVGDVKTFKRPALQRSYIQHPASAVGTGKLNGRTRQNIGVPRYAMPSAIAAKQQVLTKKRVRGGRPLAVIPAFTSVPAVSPESGLPRAVKKRLVAPQRRSIQKRILARPVIQPQGSLAAPTFVPGVRGKLRRPLVAYGGFPVSILPNTSLSRRQTGFYRRSELSVGNPTYRQSHPARSAVKMNHRFIQNIAPLNRKRSGVPLMGAASQSGIPSSAMRATTQGTSGRVDNHHIVPSSVVTATAGTSSSSSSSSSSYAPHSVVGAAAAAAAASTAPQRSGNTLSTVPPAVQQIRIVTELSRVPGPLLAQQRGHTARWSNAEADDADAFEPSSDSLIDDNEAFGFEVPRVSSGHRRVPQQAAKNMSPSGAKPALHSRRTETLSLAERFSY